jgi:hypothetical protein
MKKFLAKKKPEKKIKNSNVIISWIPHNEGLEKFEVLTKQVNFEILRLLSIISNLGVVQKMISPTMSKTT